MPGEQSDETLPGFAVPMKYKPGGERQAQADEKRARDESLDLLTQLLQSQGRLFVSKPSDIEGQVQRRRQSTGKPKVKVRRTGGTLDYSRARPAQGGASTLDYSRARPAP